MPSNILESLHSRNTSNYIESFPYGHTVITVWVDPTNTRVTDLSCSWWNRLKVVGFIMQIFCNKILDFSNEQAVVTERDITMSAFSAYSQYCNNGKEVWLVRHSRPISFLTSLFLGDFASKMRRNNRKRKNSMAWRFGKEFWTAVKVRTTYCKQEEDLADMLHWLTGCCKGF
jgi:hypothetical protein